MIFGKKKLLNRAVLYRYCLLKMTKSCAETYRKESYVKSFPLLVETAIAVKYLDLLMFAYTFMVIKLYKSEFVTLNVQKVNKNERILFIVD